MSGIRYPVYAKKDSPLIIRKADGAYVAASDIPALLEYTKDVYFLADYEMAILQEDHIDFFTHEGEPIVKELVNVPYDLEAAKKDGYDTFMLKEIRLSSAASLPSASPVFRMTQSPALCPYAVSYTHLKRIYHLLRRQGKRIDHIGQTGQIPHRMAGTFCPDFQL